MTENKVALITGAAKRVGRAIAILLHHHHYQVVIHCHQSLPQAHQLAEELNFIRANSAAVVSGKLQAPNACSQLLDGAWHIWQRLDLLINNASVFFPTPIIDQLQEQHWQSLFDINVKAPYALSLGAADLLAKQQGCIINIIDIHGEKPLRNYAIYSMTKAALLMQTKALAKELAPKVRVNGISPGAVAWPENAAELSAAAKQAIINKTLLQRHGTPEDIAQAVLYLATANYVTGEIIHVDGGR